MDLSTTAYYLFSVAILFLIGSRQQTMFSKIVPLGMALLQFLSLGWIIRADYQGGSYEVLLTVNVIGILIVAGFFGLLAIWTYARSLIDPSSESENEKWKGDDKWV